MSAPWRTRTLSPNHSCQRPSEFIFLDVETVPYLIENSSTYYEHHIRLGCACYVSWPQKRQPKEEWFDFTTAEEFWLWAKSKCKGKRVLWVYAHNALFDLTILRLWDMIETRKIVTERDGRPYFDPKTGEERQSGVWKGALAIDGIPFWIEGEWEGKRINFVDSMNYYNCSLKEMGHSCGVLKLDMPEFTEADEKWQVYCRNDVSVLKNAMIQLMEQWGRGDHGNWQPTAPSLAWSHYRHKHMPNSIVLADHGDARDLEWAAYYGGECRAYYRGNTPTPVVHYDCNSLYPSVMYGNYYPTELVDFILCPNPGIFDSLLDRFCVVAEVTLETPEDSYPKRTDKAVLYPVGRFRTALAGPELIDAWRKGRVLNLHSCAYYRRGVLFSSYVEQWFREKAVARIEGDQAREKLAKIMLNSLYGKFVQRSPQWENEPRVEVVRPWTVFPWKDPDTGIIWPARAIGWIGQVARHRRDCQHTFPAVGAYVTAYARMKMRELRRQLPKGSVYYQDTDSLFVNYVSQEANDIIKHIRGDGLGELRHVADYMHLAIRGPKNYTAEGRHVIAGVRAKDLPISEGEWVGERFERAGSVVSRNPDGCIRSYRVDFATPGTCAEGGYDDDGWYFPRELS